MNRLNPLFFLFRKRQDYVYRKESILVLHKKYSCLRIEAPAMAATATSPIMSHIHSSLIALYLASYALRFVARFRVSEADHYFNLTMRVNEASHMHNYTVFYSLMNESRDPRNYPYGYFLQACRCSAEVVLYSSQWHRNERGGVSNHRRLDCLLNRLFRCRSENTSKLCVTALCEGNYRSPVDSLAKGQ